MSKHGRCTSRLIAILFASIASAPHVAVAQARLTNEQAQAIVRSFDGQCDQYIRARIEAERAAGVRGSLTDEEFIDQINVSMRNGVAHSVQANDRNTLEAAIAETEQVLARDTASTHPRRFVNQAVDQYALCVFRARLAQMRGGQAPPLVSAVVPPPPIAAPPPAAAPPPPAIVPIANDPTRWTPPAVGADWADRITTGRARFAFFDMIRHNNTGQSNGRVIHNAAADATSCIQVQQTATRVEWGTEGRMRMVNTCDYAVDVTWCANRTECAAHPWSDAYVPSSGNTWQLDPGAEWPIFFTDPRDPFVRLGACRAAAAQIPFESLPSATSGAHQPIAAGAPAGVDVWDFHHCA